MNDIDLVIENIINHFDKGFKQSDKIKSALEVLKENKATFKNANDLAMEVGNILSDVFKDTLNSDMLYNKKMYQEMAEKLVNSSLKKAHEVISDYSTSVMENLNKVSKVSGGVVTPSFNQNKANGIVTRLVRDEFEKVKWILDAPVKTFCQSVVDDTVKVNVKHHARLGLKPVVKRVSSGNCCDWCNKIAGVYDYPDVPKDVYRRHNRCDCVVEYFPGDGKKQNVWNKKWKNIEKDDKIKERIKRSKPVDYKLANEDIADKLQVQSDEWVHKLSYDEQQAIHDYTDTFYTRINKYLRGLDVSEYFDEYYTKDDLAKSIKNLDSALNKFKLDENITFYRGIGLEELEFLKKSNEIKNFVSLTTDKDVVAQDFFEYNDSKGAVVKFNVPKNSKGAYVGLNSSTPFEREFILARNSKYTIRNRNGEWEVTIYNDSDGNS